MATATTTLSTLPPNAPSAAAGDHPAPALETLVERLIDIVFSPAPEAPQSISRSVHDARRLRQAGDLDGALAVLACVDMAGASEREARWVYSEWLDLARKRFHGSEALVYSPGTGKAAVLAPHTGGALAVKAVLGMRWRPGKLVSRRSLRGLRPLDRDAS